MAAKRRFKRDTTRPIECDPVRTLAAAVTLQAVRDYLFPNSHVTNADWLTASEFVNSQVGRDLIIRFVRDEMKVERMLGRLA